jgi:hypothetical protein
MISPRAMILRMLVDYNRDARGRLAQFIGGGIVRDDITRWIDGSDPDPKHSQLIIDAYAKETGFSGYGVGGTHKVAVKEISRTGELEGAVPLTLVFIKEDGKALWGKAKNSFNESIFIGKDHMQPLMNRGAGENTVFWGKTGKINRAAYKDSGSFDTEVKAIDVKDDLEI